MPANYVLLERIELNASAASITFSNIPQTGYTDLKVVASSRGSSSGPAEANRIHFNGDTTNTNYTGRRLLGSGSAASSDQTTAITPGFFNDLAGATANTFANSEVYIPNYTGSNSKSYSIDTVTENNGTEAYAALVAVRWSGTAAITSMTFTPESSGNFVANSTFSLYGLAALGTTPAIAPKASGGNIIDTDGTYWYHTFLASGTFTPQVGLTCDYLVVAGGGAGAGIYQGGGGGAGGYRTGTSLSISTATTVTIGAGGTGNSTPGVNGGNGTNSVFSSITSSGGGGGASNPGAGGTAGNTGGSGGGGTFNMTAGGAGNAGSYSPSEGSAGGASNAAVSGGGGGGGASAVGGVAFGTGTGSRGGIGGAGTASSISGSSVTYAGGGAGSTYAGDGVSAGGAGGGGAGGAGPSPIINPTNGTANRGGGGGGNERGGTNAGASGGSGIVIIRYLA